MPLVEDTSTYQYVHAKSAWMSARDDFKAVALLAETGAAEGSLDSIMKQGSYAEYLAVVGEPEAGTSDFRTVIPCLFTLVNGIELTAKGFAYVGRPDDKPKILKFREVLANFEAEFPGQTEMLALIDAYVAESVASPLFASFLTANDLDGVSFFDTRRILKNVDVVNLIERYQPLYYSVAEGQAFFTQLAADVAGKPELLDKLQASIDEEGRPNPETSALRLS
ncbi:MAG: hypothetical protein LBR39_07540 [Coriobacteriales bacterium]|jgi:hypothetical protein|nr:hypothetical protein [Coriobacteriales bacterium]